MGCENCSPHLMKLPATKGGPAGPDCRVSIPSLNGANEKSPVVMGSYVRVESSVT